jgi:AcrR family transcriptional regulator
MSRTLREKAVRKRKKKIGAPAGPRAVNSAETRERILKAAIGQFAQNGFSGARVDSICADADVSQRMVYHYFTDKAGLYVAVLEHVLSELRAEELKLDMSASQPLEGLLTMFDFIFNHFARHPELIRLLSAENLMEGDFLRTSAATPRVASPVVEHIDDLLRRGETEGSVRPGVDSLHLYLVMVALSYFHKSNAHTLSIIWGPKLFSTRWLRDHKRFARDLLRNFLAPQSPR